MQRSLLQAASGRQVIACLSSCVTFSPLQCTFGLMSDVHAWRKCERSTRMFLSIISHTMLVTSSHLEGLACRQVGHYITCCLRLAISICSCAGQVLWAVLRSQAASPGGSACSSDIEVACVHRY